MNYKETWKNTINAYVNAMVCFGEIKEEQKKNEFKSRAAETLDMIIEKRPDKKRSAKEQANEEQLEFIEYLEKVLETGELE